MSESLTIGCAGEIKPQEGRVALVPSVVLQLTNAGNTVLISHNAGVNSGFEDQEYTDAGAEIVDDPQEVWKRADIIVQVKEPVGWEIELIKSGALKGKILFTYLHLANPGEKELLQALIDGGVTGIAYETVYTRNENGRYEFPLLKPMSAIAGILAVDMGVHHMLKTTGGPGRVLGKVEGINASSGVVVVIGGGAVGVTSAYRASGIGAQVYLFERDENRRAELEKFAFPGKVEILDSTPEAIDEKLKQADLVVGAVYVNGTQAPKIVKFDQIKQMKKGAVLVDVPIDQGGIFEGSMPTTHDAPTFQNETGQVYYCVANMPGSVPQTASIALSNATEKYILELADKGFDALKENKTLATGLNTHEGKLYNEGVSKAHNIPIEQNPFLN